MTSAPPHSPERTHHLGGILRSVLSNWSGLAANIIVAFLLTPYVIHKLGDVGYGIWALVLQLTGYMGTFDIGMRSALVRFVSRFVAQRDYTSLSRLFGVAMIFNGIMAMLTLLAGGLLAVTALPRMKIPAEALAEAQIAVLFAAATMAGGFALGMYKTVLAGLSRWDLINGVGIATLIVRSVLTVAFLYWGYGLTTLAAIHFLSSTAGYVWNWLQVRRLLSQVRVSFRNLSADFLKPVFAHGWYALLISGANRISYEIDTVVIAFFLPVSEVTAYVLGFRLVQYVRDLVNVTAQIVAPIASEMEATGKEEGVQRILLRGSKFCFLVNHALLAALLVLGGDFLGLWVGKEFVVRSGTVLLILLAGQVVSVSQSVPSHILYGLSKHRANFFVTIFESALNLALSLWLVQHYGIYGVALGTTLGVMLARGILFPIQFLRILHVPLGDYVTRAVLPPLLPTLAFLLALWGLRSLLPVQSYLILVVIVFLALLVYLPALWWTGLDAAERTKVKDLASKRMGERTNVPL